MIHAFWLTTLVPGLAVLQIFFRNDVNRGLLATVSWAYVITAALMAPFVALAFTVHFSAQTAAIFYFALVAVSAVLAIRYGALQTLGRLLRSTAWFELALILLAIALTVPLGASAQSDSFAHSAKVRYIRDLGFYLQDAYSPLPVIETKWHVNVHHAYFAIASWIGSGEPLDLWYKSAYFFRLLAIGGVGFLAASVFRSRWLASIAMLGALPVLGTKLTIVFPFSVTGFAISAVVLGLVVNAIRRPTMAAYGRVWLGSLALATLHVGTWFLAALCIGPVVALWALWQGLLRHLGRAALMGLGIVVTGVPYLLVSALQPNYVVAQQDDLHVRMIRTLHVGDWSFTIIDPTHYAWMLPMTIALVLLALVARPLRTAILTLTGVMFFAMLFMFTPGLLDLLTKLIPYWLAQRFRNFGEVIALVMVSAGIAWMVRPRLRTTAARRLMALLVLCGSLAAFRENVQNYVLDSASQRRWLGEAHRLQEAVRGVIPEDSLVAADPAWSLVLPSVLRTRVMAQDLHHANPSDGGLLERHADTQELLNPATSADRRRAIVQKHKIGYILLHDKAGMAPPDDFGGVAGRIAAANGFAIYKTR